MKLIFGRDIGKGVYMCSVVVWPWFDLWPCLLFWHLAFSWEILQLHIMNLTASQFISVLLWKLKIVTCQYWNYVQNKKGKQAVWPQWEPCWCWIICYNRYNPGNPGWKWDCIRGIFVMASSLHLLYGQHSSTSISKLKALEVEVSWAHFTFLESNHFVKNIAKMYIYTINTIYT